MNIGTKATNKALRSKTKTISQIKSSVRTYAKKMKSNTLSIFDSKSIKLFINFTDL